MKNVILNDGYCPIHAAMTRVQVEQAKKEHPGAKFLVHPECTKELLDQADFIVLATGGIGGLYPHSTNYRHLTGDTLAVAIHHGVQLKDISYVQIHPTTLCTKEERSFLISESVRGEGAVLRDKNGERFVNELLPRDLLTKEILKQMEKTVWQAIRFWKASYLQSGLRMKSKKRMEP